MFLKLVRIAWYFSLMALVANLLYVYASLPVDVLILEDGLDRVTVSRESSFLLILFTVAAINALVYFVARFYKERELFRAWFYGLVISSNMFFIASFSFIGIFNSGEHYDFERLGDIVIGSMILFVVVATAWPVYLLGKRMWKTRPLPGEPIG